MKENICEKKMSLVEKLGVHLENREKLAPVAARIMSYIILTGKKGTTFEEMVSILCASKSTISTHLNLLQDLNKITYFTKTGDRKKYFVINSDTLMQNIDHMILEWESEKVLHEEMTDYKLKINRLETTTTDLQFDLTYHNNYIKFLNLAMASMTQLKERVAAMKLQTKP